MKKGKLSYRILTSFLALLMVFTSLPIANSYAAVSEENKNLGSVSSITDKKAQIKTEGTETTVLFNNELELNWVANGEGGVERGKDGWWVGIKLTAPKFADDEFYNILSKTKYQSKSYGSDEWKTAEGKSFWENQDSDKNDTEKNTERHIELWAFVDETSLAKAQKENENIRTEWRFDWNTENTDASAGFDAEQTVAVEIEPSAVTLKKDGKQVYPIVLKDVTAITDKTVESTTEIKDGISQTTVLFDKEIVLDWADADEGIKRGKDGWWAGVKLNAPDLGSDILSKAMYQSQSYGGELVTGKKFWDARDSKDDSSDGEYITLWAFVNEENLNTAKAAGEVIETLWNFDWNSDNVLDQSVVIQIKPDKVILKNGNEQVYPAADLGTVEGITGTVAVDGNAENSVTASYNEKVTLQWSRANKDIGRNADGWWAGIKMTAPSTKVSEVENVKYQSKAYGSDEWQTAEGKRFWNNQDSDKNNPNDGVERYITLWAYVKDQAMLNAAKADGKKILTQWRFDWNNDGVYEQYVNFELDPNNIVLDWTERYKLDTEVPVITVENSADDKEKVQWSADSATISGTVGDFQVDGYDSGIKEVYCLNSKSEKVDGFEYKDGTFRLTVNEEGELEYTIVASDNSGKEKTQKVYAKVDKTEPIINSVKIESDSVELTAVKSKDGPQIVKIDAKDVQSGIVSIVADGKDVTEKSEFEVTANGTYTVEVTDGVGKKATKEIVVDNFDDAAPSASLNLPKTSKVNEFIDKIKKLLKIEDGKIDSTVTLTVKDNGSDGENPDYVQIEKAYYYLYNVTSGSEKTLEEQAAGISKEFVEQNGIEFKDSQDITLKVGESIVFVYAVDKAGNELFDYSNGFVFEETKPQITVKNGETEIADNAEQLIKMNAAPDFVISVHDATAKGEFVSGIQEVSISVDDGEPVILNEVKDTENVTAGGKGELVFSSKSKDFPDFSNPGIYTVTVTAKDMCGNESTFTFNYKYDNIAPVFSDLTYNKLEGETDWSHSDSVTFTVKDQYTNENKGVVDASVEKVEYAIVESADADLTSESLVWKEVTGTNGKFALEAEDVKDGKYTMYVAVKYTDDCGNETEPAVQQVDIKKDTAEPVFDHFDLSVDKNNAVEGFINHLSFGTFCKESVIIRAYAKDAVSGLCGTAIMNYKANGETKSDSDVKLVRLTDDSGYYEYKLPLKDESEENIVYSEISFIISDNYIKDGKYSNTTDPKLSERKTSVENKEITDNISDITLENIAPVVGDVTFGTEKHIEVEGKNVYNEDVVQTIPITDSESGISSIDVNVKVNETENKKTFVVAENEIINEATIKYSASEQKLTFICNGKETNIEIKGLETKDNNSVSVTVKATDNAGNVSDEYIADYVIDNKAPEITDIESNAAEYIHDDVSYTFKTDELHINNEGAGVVTYTYNDGEEQTVPTDKDLKVTFTKEGKYVIKNIVVKDLLENETTVESKDFGVLTEFVIDKTAPAVKEVEFATETGNSIINFFKYGIFANDVVKVTATIQNKNELPEGTEAEKVASFTAPLIDAELSIGEKAKEVKDFAYDSKTNCWTAEFKIDLNKKGMLNLTVEDGATNSSYVGVKNGVEGLEVVNKADKGQTNIVIENFFLSENVAPDIIITKTEEELKKSNEDRVLYVDSSNHIWFNNDAIIPIHIEDSTNGDNLASGIHDVTITVNGDNAKKADITAYYDEANGEKANVVWEDGKFEFSNDSYDYDNVVKAYDFSIDTSNYDISKDGSYEIKVVATDFAGNEKTETFTVYKDTETPYVDFAFSGEGNQDSLNKDGKVELVELKDSVYGYYFSEDTQVTITAADKNDKVKDSEGKEFNPKAIGVESITYYAVDITTNNIVIKGENVKVDENNQVVFTVPANFKGQIYAYATDYLGNNYSSALICKEERLVENPLAQGGVKCVIPDKTIVESFDKHSEETHVSYEVLTKTNTKDASGFDLYNKAVSVRVTITDTYSGIRSGSVTVTSDENRNDENSNTKFDITKDMNSSEKKVGQTINGWTIEDTDGNLVTKISKTITITRNSNNILVSTTMTDRAGNSTENVKLKKFSIDTVAPEITVRYSNNSASDGKYFKANRTATITVAERNFDPSLVTAQVNGRNVSLNWNGSYSDNSNREGKTYTATITYGSDGDYKFGISCKDRAGNADNSPRKYAGQTAPTDFVIDKTAPVVTVSNTSTASPQNGNYYSKPVQVTITVVEHNWDPAKFRITYAENDRNVSRSLSWSNSGDTHTATFTCDSSSGLKYTIDYALADKAANNCVFVQNGSRVSDYRPDEFYVDQTIPEIRFTGAVDGSHNNGTVESGVVLSDTYYDRVEVTLTGKRRGVVLQQTYTDTNIDITEFVDMSRDKDDYYTISVVAYDKAGNRNENPATRSYSVNRKGSMFVLSADAKKLNAGTNSKNIVNGDIVIYEYNVDEISSSQVELWKNGNVTVLSRGSGYTVSTNDNQNGYFCYTYYIKQSLFADDAAYRVYITTKDEAGNTSTNTSKNSAAMSNLDKNNGEAPVLSFIKDTTPPAIDINLDITKTDTFGGYQIKQAAYVVTFTLADAGSGLDPDSVTVTAGNGDKIEVLDIIQNEDGSYSVTLSGIYSNLTFSFKDNAGNEDSTLVFNKVTVSANPFVRLVANTPLFIGIIIVFVAIAIIIIILLAKRKKDNDDEDENETAKEK